MRASGDANAPVDFELPRGLDLRTADVEAFKVIANHGKSNQKKNEE